MEFSLDEPEVAHNSTVLQEIRSKGWRCWREKCIIVGKAKTLVQFMHTHASANHICSGHKTSEY